MGQIKFSLLKKEARNSLNRNWFVSFLVFLIVGAISSFTSIFRLIPFFGIFIRIILIIFVMGPLYIGLRYYFLKLVKNKVSDINNLFEPFSWDYFRSVGLYFMVSLFIILSYLPLYILIYLKVINVIKDYYLNYYHSSLFIGPSDLYQDLYNHLINSINNSNFIILFFIFLIPPIYVSIRLAMVFYVYGDNHDLPSFTAISLGWKLMKNHFWHYIGLYLSFIGWYLLSIITLFIAVIWFAPYIATTKAQFYLKLKELHPEIANQITPEITSEADSEIHNTPIVE